MITAQVPKLELRSNLDFFNENQGQFDNCFAVMPQKGDYVYSKDGKIKLQVVGIYHKWDTRDELYRAVVELNVPSYMTILDFEKQVKAVRGY